jgi:hypothetical protein
MLAADSGCRANAPPKEMTVDDHEFSGLFTMNR